MTRFFIPPEQFHQDQVVLTGADAHHLLKVLRKQVGETINVLNGLGEEFTAQITAVTSEQVTAALISKVLHCTEPRIKLCLVQSLPKADKFEWILQKNTELGVSRFQPVLTERSTIKLDPKALNSKQERWQKIIQSAAEQAGRQIIPELSPLQDWASCMANLPPGLIIIPWEGERATSLKQVLSPLQTPPPVVTVLIGPEGGFSQAEVVQAQAAGAVAVSLGPRILRTETAGLVAATAILYHFGELG